MKNLKQQFYFTLSEKIIRFHGGNGRDIVFFAKYNNESKRYTVTWDKEEGGSGSTEYFTDQVEDAISGGSWLIVANN
jgi:hypothetical protein